MHEESPVNGRNRAVAVAWLPVALAALGTAMVFGRTLSSGFALQPNDATDPRFAEFLLEHGWRWVSGLTAANPFDLPMGYPLPNLLAHAEPMLSFGPFYWPLRLLGLDASTSYGLWLVLIGLVNFAAFHALMRRTANLDGPAASVAAFLFAFGLPRVAQLGHGQLWPQPYFVLALWGLHALLAASSPAGRRRLGVLAVAAGVVLQAWGSVYNAIFLAYVCVLTALFALAHPQWRAGAVRAIREAGPIGLAGLAVALACVWPLVHAYGEVAASTPGWDARIVHMLQPRLGSFLTVWSESWFYGWTSTHTPLGQQPAVHEQALGLGLFTSLVLLSGAWIARRQPIVQLVAVLTLVMLFPTVMWPGGWTAWDALHGVLPGLGSLRAVSRVGLLLLIPASVAIGSGLQRGLASKRPLPWIAVAALCLVEQGTQVPVYPRAPFERVVERLAQAIDPKSEAFYYVGDGRVPRWIVHVDAILAAQRTGVPTINLYTGRYPPSWMPLDASVAPDAASVQRVRRELDRWIEQHGLDRDRIQLIEHTRLFARSD